jgi:protein-disulfide isomerase
LKLSKNKALLFYVLIVILIIQCVFSVIIIFQLHLINQRIFTTNQLVAEKLINNEKEELKVDITPFDIVIGKDIAPLTVFMFSSYGCSVCNSFFKDVYPKIEKEYINTGKIRFVIKLIIRRSSEDSKLKSKQAICAYKQNKFFELHNRFINAESFNDTTKTTSLILEHLEIDLTTFTQCMSDLEIDSYLTENKKTFKNQRIKGTPAFIINSSLFLGNRSFEKFQEILEEELIHQNK